MKNARIYLSVTPDFKVGDPPPHESAYTHWHEWADVQHKGGLRQAQCGSCARWHFPQELSPTSRAWSALNNRGERVQMLSRICLKCEAKQPPSTGDA